ncbi:MAG: hypothetical protein IKJ56_00995 [Bacteroidales bacterium]|nr:hypothetical protein [Bacteroidales bacterium]
MLLFFIAFLPISILAQGEFSDNREATKYNVNQFGLKVNSDGFGVVYTFAQRVKYRLRRNYEVEYDYLKNLKEVKMINTNAETYGCDMKKFVFGKVNSVHLLRAGYGYNWMLFDKRDKGSVSIHLQTNVGFTFAFEKPMYYVMIDSAEMINSHAYYYKSHHRFEDYYSSQVFDLVTRSPYSKGMGEIKLCPGNYVKIDISFDFSQDAMRVSSFELGTIFDFYYRPLTIMYKQPHSFMWSLYIAYQFGKKYNPTLNRDYRRSLRKSAE